MGDAKRLVVVGGGITGLAAAHAAIGFARERGSAVSVTLLEASARFGGNLVTERTGGFLLDAGPDSWVRTKAHASRLATELGLGGALIGTNEGARRYFIAWGDRLHAVPEGLVLGVPTKLGALAATGLFSWGGKLRMALEPLVAARRFEGDDDESIADFAARRLGREAADRLVAPLLGGISAGDASHLSVRAAFPQLVAMEGEHGSLVRGMRAAARAQATSGKEGDETSAFVSLQGGVGDLVAALVMRLQEQGATLRLGATVLRVSQEGSAWTVEIEQAGRLMADAVLLAVPAPVAARALGSVDARLTQSLSSFAFASTATVFLGYRRSDVRHPLDGSGFVVPRSLGRPILAATWVSSKWRGRAPEGHALMRVFFGGASGEDVLCRDDDALVQLAREELRSLMGVDREPVLSRVFRFVAKSPQMRVGHLATMRVIRDRLSLHAPHVCLAGGGYDGVGIPDCIRQGQEAARALLDG
jgi:protoporphyrinogen/coproporphyrinogen III oxidase